MVLIDAWPSWRFSLATACVVAGPACGEQDDPSSGTDRSASPASAPDAVNPGPKAVSRSRYLRQGNRICRKLVAVAQRIRSQDLFTADRRNLARGFRRLAAVVERALARLRALGVPRGDETAVSRIQEQAESGLAVLSGRSTSAGSQFESPAAR